MDWQSPAALLVIAVSLGGFIYSLAKPKLKSGCGKGCGCDPVGKERIGK